MKYRAYLSIGEVLGLLVDEFPDVTISKIRFLETQGLVEPERTASGYRKFSDEHVERLRYVMREQKENYLPLKVIKDRLDGEDGTPAATPRPLPTGASWATIDTTHAAGTSPDAVNLLEVLIGGQRASGGHGIPTTNGIGPLAPTVTIGDDQTIPNVGIDGVLAPIPGEVLVPIDAALGQTDASAGSQPVVAAASVAAAEPTAAYQPEVAPEGDDSRQPDAPTDSGASPVGETAIEAPVAATPIDEAPLVATPERAAPVRAPLRTVVASATTNDDSWTAEEIAAETGATVKLLDELTSFGLIRPQTVAGTTTYDSIARQIATLAVEFATHGLEVRHMKTWRTNAEKETALFEQIIIPLVRQRNPQARQQTVSTLTSLCDLGADLRAALVRSELKQYLD